MWRERTRRRLISNMNNKLKNKNNGTELMIKLTELKENEEHANFEIEDKELFIGVNNKNDTK